MKCSRWRGGSPRHNFLSSAVGSELRAALRGKSGATIHLTNGASVSVDAIYEGALDLEPG